MSYRKLRKEDHREYLEKTYAAWLGKNIGIRLGAPVEGWTYEKIKEKYPVMNSYPIDYGIFAADDDSNGPLFFIRALLEKNDIEAKDIGDTFLNYLEEYAGFFWWGGIGVSSEHTAYENLKNGISAPESGSVRTNGRMIAEQIGGQIFIDCWAYVAGYDPYLAKKLAIKAASVTHDLNGIQGAVFVATAITLAYQRNDIHEVLDEALGFLDRRMEYYKVAEDIIAFYRKHKENWLDCFAYIRDNYGYDKYPGVCHIIPNSALMIMAMCYGENDFSKTLCILNQAGWDTDCNCGNVGSIMGALLGLKGIDEKWIMPINDTVNASSCIGCLNMQTISQSALMFTDLAYKLKDIETEKTPLFSLPYATKGIRCDKGSIETKNDRLYVRSKDIYAYGYYLADDLYDARYDPQFSPIIQPKDVIEIDIICRDVDLESYVLDCEGKRYVSTCHIKEKGTVCIKVPEGRNLIVHKVGLRSNRNYQILDIRIKRDPHLCYDFTNYPLNHYGPRYEGDYMNNIRGFVKHSGNWDIDGSLVATSSEHGLISSGILGNRYSSIKWSFIPEKGDEHLFVFNMKGFLDYWAIGLRKKQLVLIRKDKKIKVIRKYELDWEKKVAHDLEIKDGKVRFDKKEYDFGKILLNDLFGLYIGKDTKSRTLSIRMD